MAERIVASGFSDGVGAATFFQTDQYVVYDYVTDRVNDGVHALTSFPPGNATGVPVAFAPPGSSTTIDAALNGKRGFADTAYLFRFRTDAEAVVDGDPAIAAAYASPTLGLNFTRNFPKRHELNRVSVLIHESVHVNDPASGTTNVHISEWYVTPAAAPALGLTPVAAQPADFATRYDLMSTADSLHNPSSFTTFARHIFFGHDSRENI